MTDALIILADGSWGSLAGATIFTVPEAFEEEFSCLPDERDIFAALEQGDLTTVTRFEVPL